MAGDELRQRFETLEAAVLPLTGSPAADAIRRRGRRRRRSLAGAALVSVVLLGALVARGVGELARPGGGPVGPAPTTVPPATAPPATTAPATTGPTTTSAPPTTTAAAAPARLELRPDGLGLAGFGTGEREALDQLERRLGAPDERGAWRGPTPFGTCPGPVRAVRWGRLYVLFTSGPTRYEGGGRWHLFTYQVDAVQRTKVDPSSSGPTPPPEPPPLRGYSPRTAAGIGFGSTLAELRRAYGRRVQVSVGEPGMVYRFRVDLGTAGELSGSLSGGTPGATVTFIAAGAGCGE